MIFQLVTLPNGEQTKKRPTGDGPASADAAPSPSDVSSLHEVVHIDSGAATGAKGSLPEERHVMWQVIWQKRASQGGLSSENPEKYSLSSLITPSPSG